MTRRHLAYRPIYRQGRIVGRELVNTGKDYSPRPASHYLPENWYPGRLETASTRYIKGHGDTTSRRIRTVRSRVLAALAALPPSPVEG